jgi:hypothetical protein
MPDINENIGKRFASVYIDDSDIHEEEDTRLPFSHVLPDWMSPCVVAAAAMYKRSIRNWASKQ